MKTTFWHIALVPLMAISVSAQDRNPPATGATTSEQSSTLEVGEMGDHHRSWQRVTVETDKEGNTTTRTNAAYTELETGMNVRQPDGSYVAASDEIEIVRDGAMARKSRHQVSFAVNCNSPVTINMLTADGKLLQSRILGLAYTDKATGESVLIAEIKDSDGQLLMDAKNEVIYFDAFTDFKADVRYKNSKAGLEQDIILRETPPSPATYNLSPATTVLEVLTEFFNPPVPEKKSEFTDGTVNELLDFGDLKMGNGRVYVMGDEARSISVTKQWGIVDGRTFLFEAIPYTSVETELKSLPGRTASLKTAPDGVRHQVSVKRLLPTIKQTKKGNAPMKLASAPLIGKGVVLDYITASTATNYTFQNDTTYYVSGTVNLSGTNTCFESAVIKYAPTNTPKLNISSPITWQGNAYRPVVMTARDDNTVGQSIQGSTGNPYTNYFANPALYFDGTAAGTNAILQNLRIAFAQSAIVFNGQTGHVVSHAQLVNCANGITATNAEFSLRNALLHNVLTNFNGSSSTGRCEHLTVNSANWFNNNSAITMTLTNSLLVGVTNTGSFTSNSVSTGTSAAFQTVGAASHYLANNSTSRNAGTTNINSKLAADLKKLTTYPPVVLTKHFTSNTTLSAQAQRDTDTPDLGYHYDPLDYCWAALNLTNSTLQLTNGVAVGTLPGADFNPAILYVRSHGKLISEGSPTQLNRLVRYNTVQEQAVTNSINNGIFVYVEVNATATEIRGRFTDWSALSGAGDHLVAYFLQNPVKLTDCRFSASQVYLKGCPVAFTNCLWERVSLNLNDDDEAVDRFLYNNLLRGGSLSLAHGVTGVCEVHDTLFDQTTISQSGTITHDHNGYVTNYSRLSPTGAGDVILTNVPIYQTSYLDRYFYPTNGGLLNLLMNVGSRNATYAGLYHYTTTTNQVKEANSQVDIGFHYVAVNGSGQPIDTDSDGVPDYFEDANGDGNGANDPTSWQTYNSPNGLSGTAALQVFTPLK